MSPALVLALAMGAAAAALAPSAGQAQVEITEFMASNATGLTDADGDRPDWIELTNTGTAAVNLEGWYLTDDENFDPADPESAWRIPSRNLPAGASTVIFASGKDRFSILSGEMHTHFQIDAAGGYLALVQPDGETVASAFANYPRQEADIAYGFGAVGLGGGGFLGEGATGRFLVPPDGSLGTSWRGGQEPFNDSAWEAVTTGVGFDAGGGPTGFEVVDTFDPLDPGPLDGQGGWSTSSAQVTVATDPANAENQVMAQTGNNVRAWKAIDVPQGDTATLFFRMRRDGVVNISAGASDQAAPGTAFSDFEAQVNNQNDDVLKVRSGGGFLDVDAFEDGVWYAVWMVVDNAADRYRVFLRGGAHAAPVQVAAGGGEDVFDFRNGTANNPLRSFLARTGNGTTGTWSIDDIYLAGGENLGDPSAGGGYASFIHPAGDVEDAMRGRGASAYLRLPFDLPAVPPLAGLTLRVRYDDGFVAWLNGAEIARRNAPILFGHDARATAERPAEEAIVFEEIDVSATADRLVAGGNILALQGLNASAGDGDFLLVPELVGELTGGAERETLFFPQPTPGEANGSGVLGFVGDTRFDVDRGFFSGPFDVTIRSDTPGATILYTTDGSVPNFLSATSAPSPATVRISTTTVLRALATRTGFLPTNVDTQTYIFPADVLRQGNRPAGYPTTWKGDGGNGTYPADYEMDPEVVDDPRYRDAMADALLAVPTISIVTDRRHLFDPATGIYQNPQQHGSAWERPASVEFIHPDGRPGLQVDAALRIQGGHTRLPSKNPKHSFRLNFKASYGAAKLQHDLFPGQPTAVESFDQIVLRGAGNQSWLHHNTAFQGGDRERAQYIRDQWAKDTQIAMGHPGTHNTYAHLYLNGIYWGLFNPTERPTASFGASYLGGRKSDYVALNSGEGIDGEAATQEYNALMQMANTGFGTAARYAAVAEVLDLEAFADYVILQHYGGNQDWDDHNWYALRNTDGGRWYFLMWDSEYMFIRPGDNIVSVNRSNKPSRLFHRLMDNADFRLLFADRVHRHCFNGGLLTPGSVLARWEARKDEVYPVLMAESARWGDYRRDVHPRGGPTPIPLYDRDEEWQAERDRLLGTLFPNRTQTLVQQYRSAGFYPALEAPAFARHGGPVAQDFALAVSAPAGEVRFTTDGSDPRLSATAQTYTAPLVLGRSATVMARARQGSTWSALTAAQFLVGALAGPGNLAVSELYYNPTGPDGAEFIELLNTSTTDTIDLTGVQFTAGVTFTFPEAFRLAPGERALVVRDAAAFAQDYGAGPRVAGAFADGTALDNAGENIALAAADGAEITRFRYNDKGGWARGADGGGFSLVRVDPAGGASPDDPANWRLSTAPGGNPGTSDASAFAGADPLADNDGDGFPALLEYALGSSDADPADRPRFELDGRAAGEVVLTYRRNRAADDVRFLLESSPDLAPNSWEPATAPGGSAGEPALEPDGEETLGGGISNLSFRSRLPAQGPEPPTRARFFRLRLSLHAGGDP